MAASILGHLDRLADEHPDKFLYSYLDVNGNPIESYTYASFLHRVEAIAGYLWQEGRLRRATGCCLRTRRGSK